MKLIHATPGGPSHVDQRAAGIARIDRGVGLDEGRESACADVGAGERGDDAAGHGLADAERIADGEHEIADLRVARVGEGERRQRLAGVDAQHGEVDARVRQHQLAREFAAVVRARRDLLAALDDVVVGDDDAVGARR